MQASLERVLRTAMPITMLVTVAGGMAVNDLGNKIAISLVGSALAGLLFAVRFRYFHLRESLHWKKFVVDSKAAQRRLNKSFYGQYRRIIFGAPISENAFEYISIEDTLTSFVFMLICIGAGAVMWLEPAIIDFQLKGMLDMSQLAKAGFFQFFMVLLLSAGFSGLVLNILRWIAPLR